MDTIHILSIGNSFSQDAQRYVHDLAKQEGVGIETVNLFIGGCSLETHFRNMKGDKKEYILEINGHCNTGFKVSIKEALLARSWDYVTIQQASRFSFVEESYAPYATELADYIREFCPKAKLLIHQTWAYESHSDRIRTCGFETYDEMFEKIKDCYEQCRQQIRADGLVPSGEALQRALACGVPSVHRDTFHAKKGVGRFILALVWYKYLTKKSIEHVRYDCFDEVVDEALYKLAIQVVDDTL